MVVERSVKIEQQGGEAGDLFLPPGFRFHPTDEEVITSYLLQKLLNPSGFSPRAMGEVNLNKCEPWDLPSMAKMGEKEWYFFCHKDMKYPTGMRTNRATEKGYWKATGKDREIFKPACAGAGRELVGMKKTLVFYMGRAPRGSKTNWVMHEFRLEGKYGRDNQQRLRPKDEWVVCKVFHKNNNNNGEEDHKRKAGAGAASAGAEYSSAVGTPNVSSISVDATADVDGVDDGFIDSVIGDPVSSYFNTTTNDLPDFSTTTGSSFANLPSYTFSDTSHRNNNLNLHQQQAAAVANPTSVPTSTSSYDASSLSSSLLPWNNMMLHAGQNNYPMMGMGSSSSFNLHDQVAMMARALGGGGAGVPPNFSAGLPATGISQHNYSPLGRGGSYATNASAAAGTENLGA